MQKRMVHSSAPSPPGRWLNVDVLADVELTSEEAAHPVEAALTSGGRLGVARVRTRHAEHPTRVSPAAKSPAHPAPVRRGRRRAHAGVHVALVPDGGQTFREVVRQQYTFSPAGATSEVEDLNVDLVAVTALELTIIPDQRGLAYASLAEWRIA